jgi:hypothetical protein
MDLDDPVAMTGFMLTMPPECNTAHSVPVNIVQPAELLLFASDQKADACLCHSQYSGPTYVPELQSLAVQRGPSHPIVY